MAWYADVTVGSGKTHATIQAFEAAYDNTDLTGTDGVRGSLYGDCSTATRYWDGYSAGLTETCRIVIQAAAGEETDGKTLGLGALINNKQIFGNTTYPLCVELISLEFSASDLQVELATAAANNILKIAKCLFDTNNVAASKKMIRCADVGSGTSIYVGGSVFRNNTGTSEYGTGVDLADADITAYVYNCTFDNMRYAAVYNAQAAATITVKNCAALDCGSYDYYQVDTEATNKSENDGTLAASDFTDEASFDYHIPSTSSVLDAAGTAISDSWFTTLCATDFDGTAWAATPAIGAFEYVAAGASAVPVHLIQRNPMAQLMGR